MRIGGDVEEGTYCCKNKKKREEIVSSLASKTIEKTVITKKTNEKQSKSLKKQ